MRTLAFPIVIALAALSALADDTLPPPKNGGLYVIAHRGAHSGIPENTLAAYRKTIDLGCDFVEIDLRTTADAQLVSVHNSTIDAYAQNGQQGRVRDMTLAELKALDIGSRIGPEWKDERIPTFTEILELCKGRIGIYIDLKDADVEKVVGMLREFEMQSRCVWYASIPELTKVRKMCPECFPMPDPGSMRVMMHAQETIAPKVYGPSYENLSEEYVEFCKAHNALVFVDAMSPDKWDKAFALNVDGIQTDFPEELIARLKADARQP